MRNSPVFERNEANIWNESVTVLLIDDDEDDYLITKDIIEEIPHQRFTLSWVQSYDLAIEAFEQNAHDVYLVDYRLGAKTGLDLIEEAHAMGCDAPLILLTGQDDQAVDSKAMQIGAADYLVKSQITADQLGRSIRYSIQQARSLLSIRHLNLDLEARVARRTADLAKAVEDLQQSQLLYSSIANHFPHGFIMVLDRNLRFLLIDGQDLRHFSLDPEQLMGKSACILVQESKQAVMEYYLKRVLEGESMNFEFDIHQDTYAFTGVPLPTTHGEIQQILVVSINITMQKRVEAEIRNALSKEKQLNELKSRFISMASHEFRTPLSAILSSVSLISRYPLTEEQPKRDKHIARIKSNVTNLTGILDDFLSLSKLEEGKVESNPVWFDLPSFVFEVSEEMNGVAKMGQTFEVSHSGDREVWLDKRLLKNILINLISNATKYSSTPSQIEIMSRVQTGYIVLTVKDHGIGIPEEEQVHLFERFYRANNATNIQGTGLGLNIVQKYVSLMDGSVEFQSKLGEGTTFNVTFARKDTYPTTSSTQ
ncbi:MAG: ATP-binding protein [Bacteroidia bacterium]|nr:ATP-binding protein [Bacteroidia bacterium]